MSKVFFASDKPASLAALQDLFEAHREFSLYGQAQTGVEAISKAEQVKPGLIILDFSDFSEGLRAAEALKQKLPRAQLFLLTEGHSFEMEREAVSHGIDAVFSKHEGLAPLLSNAQAACSLGDLGKKNGNGQPR